MAFRPARVIAGNWVDRDSRTAHRSEEQPEIYPRDQHQCTKRVVVPSLTSTASARLIRFPFRDNPPTAAFDSAIDAGLAVAFGPKRLPTNRHQTSHHELSGSLQSEPLRNDWNSSKHGPGR
jgi:hypothetical protein